MNIKFYKLCQFFSAIALLRTKHFTVLKFIWLRLQLASLKKLIVGLVGITLLFFLLIAQTKTFSEEVRIEPVEASVIVNKPLTSDQRATIAQCLGWEDDETCPLCLGAYKPLNITPLTSTDVIRIGADQVSFYRNQCSTLSGHVEVQQAERVVRAQTAYVYRDVKTDKITKIELLGEVHYLEPDKLMIARKACINPLDKSGQTEDVIYRFHTDRCGAILPAIGRASLIQRFANQDLLLQNATYSTCAPKDRAWEIEARSIKLDNANATGVARGAKLRIHDWPILYAPYLSFPTSSERKSGFLMPLVGYSNIGGADITLPYYWNIAPNYDLTILPHVYSKRGFMAGGEYRFLTTNSIGIVNAHFLPSDRAFREFLQNNETEFGRLRGNSSNRWSFDLLETTHFTPNLQFNADIKQVSDDYYLQDFSANLDYITERQLLRQVDLTYTTDHWTFRGMGQSYQTLHPINESFISNVYSRLPQLMADGFYYDLPYGAHFNVVGQFDEFRIPSVNLENLRSPMPEGPRLHFNPILSFPWIRPWAYFNPAVQFVENYYQVSHQIGNTNTNFPFFSLSFLSQNPNNKIESREFNRLIPRYSIDTGLYFERGTHVFGDAYVQTLEPRLFYLRVPFQNQTAIPVYDSAYMIFNVDQLFRTNRFSGVDRIGDTNQLSYAITSRWLSDDTGAERGFFSIGQILYFANRRVPLCQNPSGFCVDNPLTFGFLSPTSVISPIASRATYYFNPSLGLTADYVFDPARAATNNSDLNLHYQPRPNEIFNVGYSYLVNGDVTLVRPNNLDNNALHQATFAFSWPFTDNWSSLGIYGHNISKNYSMVSLAGLQYDSCCWAMRLLASRTFKSLNNENNQPSYNNNVFFQILLKGLGSVASSDPASILNTYIPGYNDLFHH